MCHPYTRSAAVGSALCFSILLGVEVLRFGKRPLPRTISVPRVEESLKLHPSDSSRCMDWSPVPANNGSVQ